MSVMHSQDQATGSTASAASGQEAIAQFQDTCWKLMQDLEGGRLPSDAAGQGACTYIFFSNGMLNNKRRSCVRELEL